MLREETDTSHMEEIDIQLEINCHERASSKGRIGLELQKHKVPMKMLNEKASTSDSPTEHINFCLEIIQGEAEMQHAVWMG